eukprot:4037798-Pleurochrysis_carterae.AAC.5
MLRNSTQRPVFKFVRFYANAHNPNSSQRSVGILSWLSFTYAEMILLEASTVRVCFSWRQV